MNSTSPVYACHAPPSIEYSVVATPEPLPSHGSIMRLGASSYHVAPAASSGVSTVSTSGAWESIFTGMDFCVERLPARSIERYWKAWSPSVSTTTGVPS